MSSWDQEGLYGNGPANTQTPIVINVIQEQAKQALPRQARANELALAEGKPQLRRVAHQQNQSLRNYLIYSSLLNF